MQTANSSVRNRLISRKIVQAYRVNWFADFHRISDLTSLPNERQENRSFLKIMNPIEIHPLTQRAIGSCFDSNWKKKKRKNKKTDFIIIAHSSTQPKFIPIYIYIYKGCWRKEIKKTTSSVLNKRTMYTRNV